MSRVVTFGRMPDEIPEGNFVRVEFPELARLDQGTNESWLSRVLSSDGADARSLPRTISFQELDTVGHDMAAAVGSMWEITVDGETGILSGKGFLADDEWGHKAGFAIKSKKLFHNSIDLAEVTKTSITEEGDPYGADYKVTLSFDEWKYGKTCIVAMPAFADAHGLVGDELKASLAEEGIDTLVVDCPAQFSGGSSLEIVAGMSTRPSWDYFNVPEPDALTSITVDEPDEFGWTPVYGHFADWSKLHRNAGGRLVHPPRGADNYAHFCSGKVLTDKGMVKVGPITLLGGHVTLQQALENVENTWADVRVVDGKFGPWVCGVVRPHIANDLAKTYVARASQVSGFWPDGETLRLICSVSAAGFPVLEETTDNEFALAASLSDGGNGVLMIPAALKSFRELGSDDQRTVKEWVQEALRGQDGVPLVLTGTGANVNYISFSTASNTGAVVEIEAEEEETEDLTVAAAEERARRLAEGGLADLLDFE